MKLFALMPVQHRTLLRIFTYVTLHPSVDTLASFNTQLRGEKLTEFFPHCLVRLNESFFDRTKNVFVVV